MFLLHPTRAERRVLIAGLAGVTLAAGSTFAASAAFAATADIRTLEDTTAAAAAQPLIGAHVSLTSATLTHGRDVQAGSFSGLSLAPEISAGLALSTGSLRNADPASPADVDFTRSSLAGPNAKLTTTGDLGGPGSAELTAMTGTTTYDAAQLDLTVVPAGDTLSIVYQFGSEEYVDWSAQDYTDAVGIFVDDTLCSVVGDQPAGIETINEATAAASFVANADAAGPSGAHDTEMNGFTTALTCTATVEAGAPVRIVAAVADTVDGQLDTTLLLGAGGITSSAPVAPVTPQPGPSSTAPGTAAPTGSMTPVVGAVAGAGTAAPQGSLARTGGDSALVAGAVLAGVTLAAAGTGFVVRARRRAAMQVSEQ